MLPFAGVLALVFMVYCFFIPAESILFLAYCMGCSFIFIGYLAYSSKSYFHHPFIFILFTVFIGVTLRAFLMVKNSGNDPRINDMFLRNEPVPFFVMPAFMLFTAFILFIIGYFITRTKINFSKYTLFRKDYPWQQDRLYILIVTFFVVAIVGIILFLRAMGITSILSDISGKRFLKVEGAESYLTTSFSYYRLMVDFIKPAMYIFILNFIIEKKRIISWHGLMLILLVMGNLFFPFFTSSRSDLLTIFLNVMIIVSLTGKLKAKLVLPLIIVPVLLFNIITLLRPSGDVTTENTEISVFDPFIFNKNLLDISKTGHIINGVPEKIEFMYGSSFLAVIYSPIPRVLWPQKPAVSIGKDISHKIYGFSNKVQAGIPPGIAAELYVNFGYAGILVGFFLIGMLLKWLYAGFEFSKGMNKNRAILYTTIVVDLTITLFGSSINQTLIGVAQAFIPMYIALKIITDSSSKRVLKEIKSK